MRRRLATPALGRHLPRHRRPPAAPVRGQIGLDEYFTIHDRGDSEDLMGMVRHDIGLTADREALSLKGTCLSIYSRVVNSGEPLADVLRSTFPWCKEWEGELKRLFGAYVDAKQEQNVLDYDDLLLFWADMAADPALGRPWAPCSTTCWSTNTRTPTACRQPS